MSVPYLGDFAEDAKVYLPFNTFESSDPALSTAPSQLADTDIYVHKDGSATPLTTDGASVAITFASAVGVNLITVDTAAHADFSTGSDYHVRVEGVTIDAGVDIDFWVGHFSIENRHGSAEIDLVLADTESVLADAEAIVLDTESGTHGLAILLADTEATVTDTESGTHGLAILLADTEATRTDTNLIVSDTESVTFGLAALLADTEATRTDAALIVSDTESVTFGLAALLADTEATVTDTESGTHGLAILLADTEATRTDAALILTDTEAATGVIADTESISDALQGLALVNKASVGATGNTTTAVHLATGLGSYSDGELDGYFLVIFDNGTSEYHVRNITTWTNTGDLATVGTLPFTPATDDFYWLLSAQAGAGADTSAILQDTEAIVLDTESGTHGLAILLADTEATRTDAALILTDAEAIVADTESGTFGLAALLADTEATVTDTESGTHGLAILLADTEATRTDAALILTDAESIVLDTESGTHGLAILLADTEATRTDAGLILTDAESIVSDTESGTFGLAALLVDTETIAAVQTQVDKMVFTSAGRIDSNVEAINNNTVAADNLGAHALESLSVTFTTSGGSTTAAVLNQVDGGSASGTDDVYNGRILLFNNSSLNHQVAEITDYVGSTKVATISAITTPPTDTHTARME